MQLAVNQRNLIHCLTWGWFSNFHSPLVYSSSRLDKLFSRKSGQKNKKDPKKDDDIIPDADSADLIERKRLENMELRFYITSRIVLILADSLSVATFRYCTRVCVAVLRSRIMPSSILITWIKLKLNLKISR